MSETSRKILRFLDQSKSSCDVNGFENSDWIKIVNADLWWVKI